MSRKSKQQDPSVFRFMCIRSTKGTNYHTDFATKEEAIDYIQSINDPKIEWYGLYEISPNSDHLITVLSKRVVPLK